MLSQPIRPAASAAHSPRFAAAVSPQPAADRGAAAFPHVWLPRWAQTVEARALLVQICANPPERTRGLDEGPYGQSVNFGYRGRPAAQLRELYKPHYLAMISLLGRVEFGTPEYQARSQAFTRYDRRNNADAVIARVLGQ